MGYSCIEKIRVVRTHYPANSTADSHDELLDDGASRVLENLCSEAIKAIRILGSLSSWQSLVEEAAIAVVNDPVGVGYVVRSGVGVNHLVKGSTTADPAVVDGHTTISKLTKFWRSGNFLRFLRRHLSSC